MGKVISQKIKILFFSLAFIILFLLPAKTFDSIDGLMYLNTAKSIVYQGNFSINEKIPSLIKGVTGEFYSVGGLGWTICLVIPIWINKIAGGNIENIQLVANFTNPFLSFCLLIVLYKLYSLISKNQKIALIVAAITVFSTNLLPLSKHSFAHMFSILTIISSIYFGLKCSSLKKTKNLILSGIFYGLFILSYNYSFVLVSFVLFLVLIFKKVLNKKIITYWFIGVIPFISLFFFYNYFRFGNIFETGYLAGSSTSTETNLRNSFIDGFWGLLLSPGKSIWVYSPILIYSFYLSLKNIKKNWVYALFVSFLTLNTIFYARLAFWSGELSYGPRYFAILIPFGGLVLVQHWHQINKKILTGLVLLGLWVQFVGVSIPYTKQYQWYDMEFMCVGSQGLSRQGEFDYWSIGQFIPRYSPPYRLKKELFQRWNNLIFKRNGDLPDFWWVKD